MSKAKAIGTKGETGVKRALHRLGIPDAERNALFGADDRGDLRAGNGLLCVQVKAGQMARDASLAQLDLWWLETVKQAERALARVPMLVVQRRGYGYDRAEYWRALLSVAFVAEAQLVHGRWIASHDFPVEMTLVKASRLLRVFGIGLALEGDA